MQRRMGGHAAAIRCMVGCGLVLVARATAVTPVAEPTMAIREFRVQGVKQVPRLDLEEAVYPFLGPGRTASHVELARAAVEKIYRDKGYQTVSVQIPPQRGVGGIVFLRIEENPVGRTRVRGARYSSPRQILRQAPSMAPGTVLQFQDVTRDMVALNRRRDRKVTPELRPGLEPGTVDIELTVEDQLPLHGNLEVNNRKSPDTVDLRINGSVSYENLWQLGHALGLSFQVAPEEPDDAKVFSAYYSAPVAGHPDVTLMVQATKQDSDVGSVGGTTVIGNGGMIGARAVFALPQREKFYHSVSLGIDYKRFTEDLEIEGSTLQAPTEYVPVGANYSAAWDGQHGDTEMNLGVNMNLRGLGSSIEEFQTKRYGSDGSYLYLRGDAAHTRELKGDWQLYGRVQGQLASQPLPNSEQFAAGGLTTARGYLESEALGDTALFATVELRSPRVYRGKEGDKNELRFHVFCDAGHVWVREALPGQDGAFGLASLGAGTRFRVRDAFYGSLDAGLPLLDVPGGQSDDWRVTFRLGGDF
jgi:hemolysin activation/secretion protein